MSLLSQIGSAVTGQWGKNSDLFRQLSAALDVLSRMRLTHSCPDYEITSIGPDEFAIPVEEEVVLSLTFGRLLHFKKDNRVHPTTFLMESQLECGRRAETACFQPE